MPDTYAKLLESKKSEPLQDMTKNNKKTQE